MPKHSRRSRWSARWLRLSWWGHAIVLALMLSGIWIASSQPVYALVLGVGGWVAGDLIERTPRCRAKHRRLRAVHFGRAAVLLASVAVVVFMLLGWIFQHAEQQPAPIEPAKIVGLR